MTEKTPESQSEQEKQPMPVNTTPEFKREVRSAGIVVYNAIQKRCVGIIKQLIKDGGTYDKIGLKIGLEGIIIEQISKKTWFPCEIINQTNIMKKLENLVKSESFKPPSPNNSDSQIKEKSLGFF